MPENPLLPDAELRALLALTRRCTVLDAAAARKKAPPARRAKYPAGREAVLAATTLQLGSGDLFLPEDDDSLALALSSNSDEATHSVVAAVPGDLGKANSRLLLATAMALALRHSGSGKVVLLLTQAGIADPAWGKALAWAQDKLLPLVVVCVDPSGPAAFSGKASAASKTFDWATVSRSAARLQLPVLTLDGDDAVAMYRATQEALLRARAGGGPAILWAALPTAAQLAKRPRNQQPLTRLAGYLRTRGISRT